MPLHAIGVGLASCYMLTKCFVFTLFTPVIVPNKWRSPPKIILVSRRDHYNTTQKSTVVQWLACLPYQQDGCKGQFQSLTVGSE